MTGDHWGFVAAAYGLAVIVLGAYWRRLVRKERELRGLTARLDSPIRSRQPSMTGHPRPEPSKRGSLQ